MNLTQLLTLTSGRIVGGGEYGWNHFGFFSWTINICDENENEVFSCVYDTETFEVYTIEIVHPKEPFAVRWIQPEYADAFLKEMLGRGYDADHAYDNVKFHRITESQAIEFIEHFVRLDYSVVDKFKVWQYLA